MAVTINMLPDVLACAAMTVLAIYHLMIFWGRKKDPEEAYNLYFSLFVICATLFVMAPYLQPQYFLYALKPDWLYVINVEALMSWGLFISGIKFLNLLLKPPSRVIRFFRFTYYSITLNFFLTLSANFISTEFYFKNVLAVVLAITAINVILIFAVYGRWLYREKLYKINFYRIFYAGFMALTINILVYRTIELLTIPNILVFNHYVSVVILFIFAYALSVKFNKEYVELKDLKISLERKVEERTAALAESNHLLAIRNNEVEKQKLEIENINNELTLRAEELTSLNQARSRFFTGISHEFRTPLTLILGPLEMLLSKTKDAKLKGDYELMIRQAKRLLSLINQLLELSKLQRGTQTLNLVKDNINQFLQAITSLYQPLAVEKKIQLTLVEEHSGLNIHFDPDKVEKIITNLLSNAMKFTPSGGSIEVIVSLTTDAQFAQLIVRDSGIGIETENLNSIFDPFYQVDPVPDPRFDSSGVGLSLAKELVEICKGTIAVTSEIDRGTSFTVLLPVNPISDSPEDETTLIEPKQASEDTIGSFSNIEINNHKIVVLLVEDNADMRSFIKQNLPSSYQIIEAEDGAEGLRQAQSLIPDLIIADVMMPVLSGIEMTKKIKQDESISHIPVIILTAKASIESKIEGLSTQADDYITKPFNINELTLRIQNLLINRQKLKEKFTKCITVNPSELVTTSTDEKFLQRALDAVEKNIEKSDFSAELFSEAIFVSRAHAHRKLKALTGQSATEFIRSVRLKRAVQLLRQNAGTVSEIAYQTGFNNLSYFTKCFKDTYGTVPSMYASLDRQS
jgi:signal transduction histidine kinase/CheY-like chemotaxis protein